MLIACLVGEQKYRLKKKITFHIFDDVGVTAAKLYNKKEEEGFTVSELGSLT